MGGRRIAKSGAPHSGQCPSQPGRPLGSVTSSASAIVTFRPQTHQPCGPGGTTGSDIGVGDEDELAADVAAFAAPMGVGRLCEGERLSHRQAERALGAEVGRLAERLP